MRIKQSVCYPIMKTPEMNFHELFAAASEIARVKHLLRDRAVAGLKPTEVLSSVNKSLAEQHAERFTALTYMNYNLSTGVISMIAAGNPFPVSGDLPLSSSHSRKLFTAAAFSSAIGSGDCM